MELNRKRSGKMRVSRTKCAPEGGNLSFWDNTHVMETGGGKTNYSEEDGSSRCDGNWSRKTFKLH